MGRKRRNQRDAIRKQRAAKRRKRGGEDDGDSSAADVARYEPAPAVTEGPSLPEESSASPPEESTGRDEDTDESPLSKHPAEGAEGAAKPAAEGEGADVQRIKGKAKLDGTVGWITIASSTGSAFLELS